MLRVVLALAWSCASHDSGGGLVLSPTDLPPPLPPSLSPYLPPSPSSGGASHVEWECRLVTGFPPNSRRLPLPARLEWSRLQGSRSQGSRARACRSAGAGRKSQRVCEVACPAPMTAGWSGGPGWRLSNRCARSSMILLGPRDVGEVLPV